MKKFTIQERMAVLKNTNAVGLEAAATNHKVCTGTIRRWQKENAKGLYEGRASFKSVRFAEGLPRPPAAKEVYRELVQSNLPFVSEPTSSKEIERLKAENTTLMNVISALMKGMK